MHVQASGFSKHCLLLSSSLVCDSTWYCENQLVYRHNEYDCRLLFQTEESVKSARALLEFTEETVHVPASLIGWYCYLNLGLAGAS